MSLSPTPNQALLLFALLARHGESPQAELVPAVAKADREQLVSGKLLDAVKIGRGLRLRLTDGGWAWAGANLSAALPPAHRALHHLLGRVADHLADTGETLAEFIGPPPDATDAAARSGAAEPKARKTRTKTSPKSRDRKSPKPPTAAVLRKRIEAAYLALTAGRKDESVPLLELRRELGDLDRETVDAGLGRILKGDRKASLMRHDDPRQIGSADQEAAFSPAGEPFHLLWIAS